VPPADATRECGRIPTIIGEVERPGRVERYDARALAATTAARSCRDFNLPTAFGLGIGRANDDPRFAHEEILRCYDTAIATAEAAV
jgi:hypothetical protein